VTDTYAKGLATDVAWRMEWANRIGLDFALDGLLGLQNVVQSKSRRVA
jgi:hypothetical protein